MASIQRVPASVPERACDGYDRAMPSPRRLLAAIGVTFAIVLLSPIIPAHADDALQECIDQAEFHDGELPTCTEVDGGYEASWPDDAIAGGSGGFVALFVIVSLAGVAVLVWKVSTARRLATESGMDPNLATQLALLTDDGLNSTYVAANLRRPADAPVASPPSTTTAPAAQRLAELRGLLDDGLITQAEFDGRRAAIIDGV